MPRTTIVWALVVGGLIDVRADDAQRFVQPRIYPRLRYIGRWVALLADLNRAINLRNCSRLKPKSFERGNRTGAFVTPITKQDSSENSIVSKGNWRNEWSINLVADKSTKAYTRYENLPSCARGVKTRSFGLIIGEDERSTPLLYGP